jgi:hypothetical protein
METEEEDEENEEEYSDDDDMSWKVLPTTPVVYNLICFNNCNTYLGASLCCQMPGSYN